MAAMTACQLAACDAAHCRWVGTGGRAFVEIGAGQQAQVTAIARRPVQAAGDAGDLAGIVRCLVLRRLNDRTDVGGYFALVHILT